MAGQLRVVRRRIRTVQSTMKITRAMELISASRVVRAQQRVEQSRPYTNLLVHALSSVETTEGSVSHPLLQAFLDHDVDEIHAVFTDYVSPMTQRATAIRFVPLVVEDSVERPPYPIPMYIYEPSAQAVLDALMPRYLGVRVFTAMLE